MFKEHNIDEIIEKCSGKFRSTVLIQKRLKGLSAGYNRTKLAKERDYTLMETVLEEIMEENIKLVFADTAQTVALTEAEEEIE